MESKARPKANHRSPPLSTIEPISKPKPKKYKLPPFYDPFGPRPPPSDKVISLADRIASLSPDELRQVGPYLREKLRGPKIQELSSDAMVSSPAASGSAAKVEEKKVEKTAFDVKLEKFDASSKIKVIKEVRAFTNLGLKEAKELVEKAPVLLKQGCTKEEANDIIEKIKAVGGMAVME
ncbi:uncharacterized protein LOC18425233 isoform X2 [Amborella trichopoda]|uniref:uncharacterized protein LOC18425233 isoform X2 n=1 Tax=Amborella trichopoda TaxID=13333 RepID=UPI0005D3ECC6|nr:uncharacterized protein LOC18425233 isoform X2 [Amborella trichopoda]|eukprot:XP_011629289.1 uncharacterized protein LOC18425233 isoform X2 [Amborella trichopoda]